MTLKKKLKKKKRLREEEEERLRQEEEKLQQEKENELLSLEELEAYTYSPIESTELVEPVKPTEPTDNNNLLSLEELEAYTYSPSEETRTPLTETGEVATFKREFKYGMAQEPTVAGSLYRLGKAKLKSLFSEKSYSEIAQDIEAERQQELRELFPEFAGKVRKLELSS